MIHTATYTIETPQYPKLMSDGMDILLFTCSRCGMVIHSAPELGCEVGYYTDDWDMDMFEDYYGNVTLGSSDEML